MKKIIFHIVVLYSLILNVSAQVNLVPNPSFEDTLQCPFNPGQIYFAVSWSDPDGATSDLFHTCNSGVFGIPSNAGGNQTARTGIAYAGMATYYAGGNNREYIQAKLKTQLLAGRFYYAEFYVSMADTSFVAANNIGIYFSDTAYYEPCCNSFNVVPQVNNDIILNPLTDKIGWTKVSGSFVASGTENYITIGNFLDDISTDTVLVSGGSFPASYYYIDDVSIICTDCPIIENELMIPTLLGGGEIFEIKGLPVNSELYLFNSLGQIVYSTSTYDNKLNTINFSSGMYYYYLKLPNGDIYKGKLCIVN